MDAYQAVNGWLSGMGVTGGAGGGALGDGGLYAGSYREKVDFVVEAPQGQGAVYLYATILPAHQVTAGVLRVAMERNFFRLGARGVCLALDSTETLRLCLSADTATLDGKGFENLLGNLISLAESLSDEFAAMEWDEEEDDADDVLPTGGFGGFPGAGPTFSPPQFA